MAEYIFCSSTHGTFTKIDHIGCKTSLSKLKELKGKKINPNKKDGTIFCMSSTPRYPFLHILTSLKLEHIFQNKLYIMI